jgi:hypothetical protein
MAEFGFNAFPGEKGDMVDNATLKSISLSS